MTAEAVAREAAGFLTVAVDFLLVVVEEAAGVVGLEGLGVSSDVSSESVELRVFCRINIPLERAEKSSIYIHYAYIIHVKK